MRRWHLGNEEVDAESAKAVIEKFGPVPSGRR